MSDVKFVDGLMAYPPHEEAPDFVKCALSIDRAKMIEWLTASAGEKIKVDIKIGRSGKWYAAVNDWKPTEQPKDYSEKSSAPSPDFDDDLPF